MEITYLDSDLESIEASGFRYLDLLTETFNQILINDAITGSEER